MAIRFSSLERRFLLTKKFVAESSLKIVTILVYAVYTFKVDKQ